MHPSLARMISILIGLCALSLAFPATANDALPKPVQHALREAGIPTSSVAVMVQEAGGRKPSLQVNSNVAMNPASVMKLLTTYAGLEMLGTTYTWKTEIFSSATAQNGVLTGDIYLKGNGDPRLTFEQFWLLLRQLKAQGIREIRGDLILDRTAFNIPDSDPFDDQPLRPYNVKPDALLINWKSLRLQLEAREGKVQVDTEPSPANLNIINRLTLTNSPCGDWKRTVRADLTEHAAGRYNFILTGSYSSECGKQQWHFGLLDHTQYVDGVFRQLWIELGGDLSGGVKNGKVPADAKLLASIESPALSEVIRDINKFSNNVMARQLFLSLGEGTTASADKAVREWLGGKKLDFSELVLENGSGLSRRERINATHLVALLNAAWQSQVMPEFIASMPITGVDGTLKKRLKNSTATGQGHLKTGTLEGVKTLVGYVRDKNGKWQIVAFLINHPNASAGQTAQDALVQWVVER